MRRPLVDLDADQDARTAARRISDARWGRIAALYGMMLHSPVVAEGWVGLGTAIRRRTGLDDRTRELAICLVARVCDQSFEWDNHAPLARDAGATDAELTALLDRDGCESFSAHDRLVLDIVEATARGTVTDELLESAGATMDDRELVEVVATASFYVGTAHFLSAFGIEAGAPGLREPGGDGPD